MKAESEDMRRSLAANVLHNEFKSEVVRLLDIFHRTSSQKRHKNVRWVLKTNQSWFLTAQD
jgi:hypothetical protein